MQFSVSGKHDEIKLSLDKRLTNLLKKSENFLSLNDPFNRKLVNFQKKLVKY